jgi:hypothetical protein
MTRGEEAIIKGFLVGAHKAVEDATPEKKACAESAYDIISRLAEQLKIDNPYNKK